MADDTSQIHDAPAIVITCLNVQFLAQTMWNSRPFYYRTNLVCCISEYGYLCMKSNPSLIPQSFKPDSGNLSPFLANRTLGLSLVLSSKDDYLILPNLCLPILRDPLAEPCYTERDSRTSVVPYLVTISQRQFIQHT